MGMRPRCWAQRVSVGRNVLSMVVPDVEDCHGWDPSRATVVGICCWCVRIAVVGWATLALFLGLGHTRLPHPRVGSVVVVEVELSLCLLDVAVVVVTMLAMPRCRRGGGGVVAALRCRH